MTWQQTIINNIKTKVKKTGMLLARLHSRGHFYAHGAHRPLQLCLRSLSPVSPGTLRRSSYTSPFYLLSSVRVRDPLLYCSSPSPPYPWDGE